MIKTMVVAHPADRQMDCSEALRDCPVPLLYLAGSKDAIVTRRSLEQILAVRLDISVATLDGPHLLLQESPEEAARIIERFVRACTLDPPDQ